MGMKTFLLEGSLRQIRIRQFQSVFHTKSVFRKMRPFNPAGVSFNFRSKNGWIEFFKFTKTAYPFFRILKSKKETILYNARILYLFWTRIELRKYKKHDSN